jgi:hypothetical protein
MLIITGANNQVTSHAFELFKEMGYLLDSTKEIIYDMNLNLIKKVKGTGLDISNDIKNIICDRMSSDFIEKNDTIAVKDIKFLYFPYLFEFWKKYITSSLSVLIILGHPDKCMPRVEAKKNKNGIPLEVEFFQTAQKYKMGVGNSILTLLQHEIPCRILYYPRYMTNFAEFYITLRLLQFPVQRDNLLRVWKSLKEKYGEEKIKSD